MQIIPIRAPRPAPRILPDTTDETLEERAFARLMGDFAELLCFPERAERQHRYASRLDALAAQRGQE